MASHSHRRARRHFGLARATGLVAATVAAAALVPAIGHADPLRGSPADSADPAPDGVDAVKQQVAALYQQAEADTQQFDATEERIARLQAAVATSGARSAQLRGQLAAASAVLGRLAAEQYREAGMSPSMALVLFAHPDSFLERAGMTERMATVDRQRITSVMIAQQALTTLERESSSELSDLHAAELQLAAQRADIESRLSACPRAAELAQRGAARAGDRRARPRDGGDGLGTTASASAPSLSSLLSTITGAATSSLGADSEAVAPPDASRVVKAVETAYNELGKPYVWGATGPGQFDCSGLTQHVWAAAGVQLPRTSQEQARAGRRVPLADIQPGDLVVYYSGATHIGIYVGRGLVIHAPRPGSVVQFTPVNSMPIDKVVRPVS